MARSTARWNDSCAVATNACSASTPITGMTTSAFSATTV